MAIFPYRVEFNSRYYTSMFVCCVFRVSMQASDIQSAKPRKCLDQQAGNVWRKLSQSGNSPSVEFKHVIQQ